ncbi:uncharacterized protein [Watersipora subatra]|uniref:uncharacterized protein n=1 Tax=Watersipora subatra TaxID=2589382 RepID=UPI00355B5CE0
MASTEQQESKSENTLCSPEAWGALWKQNITPWHEAGGNRLLWKHFGKIMSENFSERKPEDLKVFVPLCGKAKDMYLFYQMGFTVVGVEFSPEAISEFFKDNGIATSAADGTSFTMSSDGKLIIGQGDIYSFTSDKLPFPKYDIIWDRGSFEAINKEDREKYVQQMVDLFAPDGTYLIYTNDYNDSEYSGPPMRFNMADMQSYFGAQMSVEPRETEDLLAPESPEKKMWNNFGLTRMTGNMYMMKIGYLLAGLLLAMASTEQQGTKPKYSLRSPEAWRALWTKNVTPWHEEGGNELLWKHFGKIMSENFSERKPEDLKVFVPLCGKAKDMYLFYKMGFTVVGVEFSSEAISEFFKDNEIATSEADGTSFTTSSDEKLIIGQGDIYSFTSDKLPFPKYDIIWDRGSFEAINKEDREKYVQQMVDLFAPDGTYLIYTNDYNDSEYSGPPMRFNMADMQSYFGAMSVEAVETEDLLAPDSSKNEMWIKAGLTRMTGTMYIMKTK